MLMSRFTQFKYFEIWQPRWRDRTVLLADFKVGENNKIVFTKAPNMGTDPYYISGKAVKKFKKESNGKINCFVVPVSELEPLELEDDKELMYK